MGRTSQRKGGRVEREIVALHKDIGVHAERCRFRGSGHDLDIYARGKEEAPFVCEVKSRKNGGGFVQDLARRFRLFVSETE
jgi:Holliday junction resolvase